MLATLRLSATVPYSTVLYLFFVDSYSQLHVREGHLPSFLGCAGPQEAASGGRAGGQTGRHPSLIARQASQRAAFP